MLMLMSGDAQSKDQNSIDSYIASKDLSTISRGSISYCAWKLKYLGRYEDAIAFCDRVLEHQPHHPEAYCSKGLILADLQRYEESLVQYDLAIQYNYEFTPAAYYYKSLSLFKLKRYEEALVAVDKAIAMGLDDRDTSWARECALYEIEMKNK